MNKSPTFKPIADRALLVELGQNVDDEINRQVIALDKAIAAANIAGIDEVVPALVNLLVIFDPLVTDHTKVQSSITNLFPIGGIIETNIEHHFIDVCYDDMFGIDLESVAKQTGMSIDAVINAHTGTEYRVSMYGFAPGYAYLTGLHENIQVPRKKVAVRDVPAGSVLIAGAQCLTTTLKMPTGWSIIGRSNTKIMTSNEDKPFLFEVGDLVRFRRIGSDQLSGVT